MIEFKRFREAVRHARHRRPDLSHLADELASLNSTGIQTALAVLAAKLGSHRQLGPAETIVYNTLLGGLGTADRSTVHHFIAAVSRGATPELPRDLSNLHADLFSHPTELLCLQQDGEEWLKLHPPGPEHKDFV